MQGAEMAGKPRGHTPLTGPGHAGFKLKWGLVETQERKRMLRRMAKDRGTGVDKGRRSE